MNMNRRNLLIAGAATAAYPLSHAANAPTASTSASTWALATGYKADSFQGRNVAEFARRVGAATGGSLRIQLHANNSLVPLSGIAAAVRDGKKVQAGEVIMSGLVKDIPIAGADSVPFVVSTYEDSQRMWQYQRPIIERHFEERGLKPLFAIPWPPQGLYSMRKIVSADDLRGAKMRTYNATTVRIAQLLGAEPVDVPASDIQRALAEGRIDTMITSSVTGVESRAWEKFKYFYEINAWFPKNLTFVNAASYNAMSSTQKRAVEELSHAAEMRGWETSRLVARDSMNELRRNGMKVEPAPILLQPIIKRLGERFSLEWVRDVGREANDVFIPFYTRG